MRIFGYDIGIKSEPLTDRGTGDVSVVQNTGVMKAYIPEFLYKPPFGYPRKENIPLIRQLARNPYVHAVIKTLCDEAASTHYEIKYKEEVEPSEEMDKVKDDITRFLDNPNNNKESFQQILRAVVKDICEVDAGLIVKIFDKKGTFVEMFARDGGSFLINPDIYGYIGNRAEYITPININYVNTPDSPGWDQTFNQYQLAYSDVAAYYQYGTTAMALPVPFGRREIIYMKANPQSNNIYGISPIQILADIITTLVYGANYNLDYYMNNNMPEGMIQLTNADKGAINAFRERFDKQIRIKDPTTGFMRRTAFKFPITNQEAKFIPFQLDPKVMDILGQQGWFTKILWACFGVTAEQMGFTENSNKAVAQNQTAVYIRKGAKPILNIIKYHIDKEIIAEWGQEAFDSLEFCWDDYDLETDIKKHNLYESQIRMGIKTAEMVANEEGIDVEELKAGKEVERQQRMEEASQQSSFGGFDDQKSIGMKALGIRKDTRVKVIKGSNAHTGKTGVVEGVRDNGEEMYYIVRFQDGMDIFFFEELKVVDGGVNIIPEQKLDVEEKSADGTVKPESMMEDDNDEPETKGEAPWNELEKELVQAVKSRGKELLSRLNMLKNSELDKIR